MAKSPPAQKQSFGKPKPKGFEKSKFDNDKGVKEGSKADLKRDAKQIPAFLKGKK